MREYIAIAAQYQADVLSGAIPACQWVRLACERNRKDLDRQETAAFPYRFDPQAGRAICAFAELLPYVSGRGFAEVLGRDEEDRPIYKTLTLQPWQVWLLTTLFGWLNAEGYRRFRVALILVPRKNGKSTLGAIVSLYMLTQEQEPGAQCYSAATTRDQAKAVAEVAWEMAKRSPAFREHYGVRLGSATTRSLTVPTTASKFMPLSADANSLDGLNVSCAVIDELHAHRTAAVWQVIDTGTSARLQPLLFAITTAGVDLGGICHQKLGYLEKVLDGRAVDDAFFGINYTIDTESEWLTVAGARKANPNFGISVKAEDIARKVNEANQQSTADIHNVLTKHFNVWVRAASTWMDMPKWIARGREGLTVDAFKGVPCWIGVDLAEVRDIAAAVALFRIDAEHYAAIGRFYLPADTIRRSPVAQMSGWVRSGYLIQTDRPEADFQRIEDDILAWCAALNVQGVCFDRALAAHMQQNLKRRLEPTMGRDAAEAFVLTVLQTAPTLTPAMQMIERLVLSGGLDHDANPALTWMVSNVVVVMDNKQEIFPRKAGGKDSPNKIDGAAALFNAMTAAMRYQPAASGALLEWI